MTMLDAAHTFPSLFDETATAATGATTGATNAVITDVAAAEQDGAPGFDSLGLPSVLVRALHRTEITTPFPIQRATIPDALAGRDVLGRGQTGSGKTLAFGLPMLARIAASGRSAPHRPKGLVLVPTRELAMQVNDALTPLAKSLGLFTKTAFGGAPYSTQIYALERGVDVLVATPGRLGDLIERGICSLDSVDITVLDEADQMADMGFLPDVTRLLEKTPGGTQRLLFSATLDNDVDSLVKRFMTNPVTHEVDAAVATVDTMAHHALLIPPRDKFVILAAIANRVGRTIMFVQTQMAVDRVVEQLAEVGVRASALHGGKTQRVRTRTLAEFKEGRVHVLVATNVAARGLHVDGVDLVVHIDPPKDSKDYLHRAGRTARAGESGIVVTLVLPRQRRSTFAMLEKAGVDAVRTEVTAEGQALADVTGARPPSGVPVPPMPEPSFARGRRADGDRQHGRSYQDRGGRPSYGDRPARTDRPAYGDRPARTDRPAYGDRPARTDRPVYGDRPAHSDRPARTDRPSFGDRPARAERPVHSDRPGYADRRGHARPRVARTPRP